MNQSNKRNLEFIKNSGVNYLLQDTPRNWFKSKIKPSSLQISKNADNDKLYKIEKA